MYDIFYMQNLKNDTNELTKQKETHRLNIFNLWLRWVGTGGIVRELGVDMYTLLYLQWITTKTYCRTQGTLLNVMWQPGWEGSLEENGHVYIYG